MMVPKDTVILKQKRLKPLTNIETPSNLLDMSNQSVQPDGKYEASSNKNLIPNQLPYLYAPAAPQQERNQQPIYVEQQIKCWHILFPQFQVKTVNFCFISFLTLYFVGIYMYHLFGPQPLLSCTLYHLGAKFTPNIQHNGEFHRLLVSIPLFGSLLQAIISLLTLLMFGFLLEQYLGRLKYSITLALSAFVSNLMSGIAFPYYVSVGSAGFIFGVISLYISFLIHKSEQLGQQRNLIVSLLLLVVAANLLSMIDTKAIDIAGIIGGFLAGGALAFTFYEKQECSPCFRRMQYLSVFILFVFTIVFIALIFTINVDHINISQWC